MNTWTDLNDTYDKLFPIPKGSKDVDGKPIENKPLPADQSALQPLK